MTQVRERVFAWVAVIVVVASLGALSVAVVIQQTAMNATNDQAAQQINTPTQSSLVGKQLSNFRPVATVAKLITTDTKVGTGAAVKASDSVTVDYTGAVAATGTIFDSSVGLQPVSFSLDPNSANTVIQGWQIGLVGMKVGGVRRLLIPASEAYGSNPPEGSGIPVDAGLVFDVTLHKIN